MCFAIVAKDGKIEVEEVPIEAVNLWRSFQILSQIMSLMDCQ